MSECPFKHPSVSKLLAGALISLFGGVVRATGLHYNKILHQLCTLRRRLSN